MDLNQLVNELIEVSKSGTRVPGFRGKTMIDADRLGVLLSELQNNMPSGVQEAQTIITQKDSIISQAQMEASRIVDEARNSAAQISTAASAEQQEKVSDSEVLRVASSRGEEIVASASGEAQELVTSAQGEVQTVIQDAQRRAYALISDAESQAAELRQGADRYSMEVLSSIEEQLSNQLGQVRRGLDALNVTQAPRQTQSNVAEASNSVT